MLYSLPGTTNAKPISEIDVNLWQAVYMMQYSKRLAQLAELAVAEPWQYTHPPANIEFAQYAVLDKYLKDIWRMIAHGYNKAESVGEADAFLVIRNALAVWNTGLISRNYKDIYGCMEINHRSYHKYGLLCFGENTAPPLKYLDVLPPRPMQQQNTAVKLIDTSLDIRIDLDHILHTQENVQRIPKDLRDFPNLQLLLTAAVQLAMQQIRITPSIAVPQMFHGIRLQYLIPICLYEPEVTDLVMTLEEIHGYYLASTCLTPNMAYNNARVWGRPTAPWLTSLVC